MFPTPMRWKVLKALDFHYDKISTDLAQMEKTGLNVNKKAKDLHSERLIFACNMIN